MLIFLKLGGSLITEKNVAFTARLDVIRICAKEIRTALKKKKELRLLIGHGSGSFGHFAAKNAGTRSEVSSEAQWNNFQKVWYAARALNHIVVEEFNRAGLPVISFQPSAAIYAADRQIKCWNTEPISNALMQGMVPIIYGDVIFDQVLGGVIFSTEDLFFHLIEKLHPKKILIAGKEEGVYADYPENTSLIKNITYDSRDELDKFVHPSDTIDVTGGMREKVNVMLLVVEKHPETEILIFTGERKGNLFNALSGQAIGTLITKS